MTNSDVDYLSPVIHIYDEKKSKMLYPKCIFLIFFQMGCKMLIKQNSLPLS